MRKSKLGTILIVEDEVMLLYALHLSLHRAGYAVAVANDGARALAIMPKLKPDMVLLDILLPKLDGFKVLEQIKNNPETKETAVVILTNLSQADEKERGLNLGAEQYFVKSETGIDQIINFVQSRIS